jgi:3-oxoacyl-[acyl-carrier protein] reductase
MDLGLKDKVAIVTGASKGIGRAVAIELAREGCDVTIAARDAALLGGVAADVKKLGRRALAHAADLRQEKAPAGLVEACLKQFGRVDIVVNNAGATKRGDFLQLTDADFQDGFALKFMAAVRLTRAAWPHLVKSKGALVNIIGMGGRYVDPEFTIGGAVNAACMNFTKAMARRGMKEGVRVNGVNPGAIETDRLKVRLQTTMRENNVGEEEARQIVISQQGGAPIGQPEDVARVVCYLAAPNTRHIQAALVDISGGEAIAI